MFSSGPNYVKLKTHLRLTQQRLKLLEKKKTELAQKARKEIADLIAAGKVERARIRVEHIIREDYFIEACELILDYTELILARFGLVTQLKELDEGISEAVASLVWVAPLIFTDCQELKVVSDIFAMKHGKPWAEAIRNNQGDLRASEKLQHKLAIHAPPKLLVEKYLIEIAKVFNVEYEPDPQVMNEAKDGVLVDLSASADHPGPAPPPPGFVTPVTYPIFPLPPVNQPFNYPQGPSGGGSAPPSNPGGNNAFNYPQGPSGGNHAPPQNPGNTSGFTPYFEKQGPPEASGSSHNIAQDFIDHEKPPSYDDSINLPMFKPTPQPRTNREEPGAGSYPGLPSIPTDEPKTDEIDFDDLSRRFEALKKKH